MEIWLNHLKRLEKDKKILDLAIMSGGANLAHLKWLVFYILSAINE